MNDLVINQLLKVKTSNVNEVLTFNVLQIFINGVRYTNLKQYAEFLNISQEKESRENHGIESVKFFDLLPTGGTNPLPIEVLDFKQKLCQILDIKGNLALANLDRSLWLTDREAAKWTLVAKTSFAKSFRNHVIDVFMGSIETSSFNRLPNESQDEYEIRIGEAYIREKKAKVNALKLAEDSNRKAKEHFEALQQTTIQRNELAHKVETHIQYPISIPTKSNGKSEVYTQQELKEIFDGTFSLQAILAFACYANHPTISYIKEINNANYANVFNKPIEAYSKEKDINESVCKALAPNDEKQNDFKHTKIRFTSNSLEIWKHPACQNKTIRIPKEKAIEYFSSMKNKLTLETFTKYYKKTNLYFNYLTFINEDGKLEEVSNKDTNI
jgi:hypothetical protein